MNVVDFLSTANHDLDGTLRESPAIYQSFSIMKGSEVWLPIRELRARGLSHREQTRGTSVYALELYDLTCRVK